MKIISAKFIKGVVGDDVILGDGIPQVAFVGRSNAGKSSLINSLTKVKDLARTSDFPGRTQEINIFLINGDRYLVDLPGYGFAKASGAGREKIGNLIHSYLFNSNYEQKIVALIIDANVGPTDKDMDMFRALLDHEKNILIVANKIDKIKKSEYAKQLKKIQDIFAGYTVVPYSSKDKIGIKELTNEILK